LSLIELEALWLHLLLLHLLLLHPRFTSTNTSTPSSPTISHHFNLSTCFLLNTQAV
jgi:hypothetical protein